MIKTNEDENIFHEKYYDEYFDHRYHPKEGIKIGGTSMFCQYMSDLKKHQNFFQMNECQELPFSWGDSGIAHIYHREDNDKYYLQWDCC